MRKAPTICEVRGGDATFPCIVVDLWFYNVLKYDQIEPMTEFYDFKSVE